MPEKVYKVRDGFHVKGDIRAIAERIEAIQRRNATPERPEGDAPEEEILEDARDPDSPLHPNFEWDESEAARLYNLQQARYLSRSFEVHIVHEDRPPIIISPANVVIGPREDRRIVPTDSAMSREDDRNQVLTDTIRQLQGMQNRLASLRGISPKIIGLIEETKAAIAAEMEGKKTARRKTRTASAV